VQDSLLKAYTALQEGAEPELLRAWLFRIVRNTAIDERRAIRPHEQLDENYDGVEQPPQALARRESVAALMLAIQDLPASQREAIVQRELEGRGHEEIGRALNLSPGAVRQLIYRARHTLREAAGALIPAALLRAATLPGAEEAVGGLGAAGALKLGLAAVVTTGTIVAGTAVEQGDNGKAEAVQISSPDAGSDSASVAGEEPASGERGDDSSSSNSGPGSSRDDGHGDAGSSGPSGGDDGVNSGPGGGSGSSGPGSGGSSGPGGGGSGEGGSGSSGPGSGETLLSSGSGDGDGGSNSGPGSGDSLDSASSGPG
jgi:RNA polymerase sigma factor (sigma-70 family)